MKVMENRSNWMRRLKIRHLEVFVTLVDTGNQSTTAALLNVTQPALSKWLRELEQDVGCPLFERGRPLKLTAYGQVVLRYAQRVLGDSARTSNELESLRTGSSGRVRVGVLRTVAAILLPRAILSLHSATPQVQLTVLEDSLDVLLPKLERHELDCIIGRMQGEALNAGLFTEGLYDEPVHAIVRSGHPLMKRRRLDWKDAAKYPWIVPQSGTPMRSRLDAEFVAAGLPLPATRIESISLLTNEKLLLDSDMISVTSSQLSTHYVATGNIAVLPLRMRFSLGPVGLIWVDSNPTAAVSAFMNAVRVEAQALNKNAP